MTAVRALLPALAAALATVALVAGPAPAARAGGPTMVVGAAEDVVKQPSLVKAKAEVELARLVGFQALRVTAQWTKGQTAPTALELTQLRNLAAAADLAGMRLYLSVYPSGSSQTPLDDQSRSDFAAYAVALVTAVPDFGDVIVGNEPNLNRFWMPQFDETGGDAAAAAYEQLLAVTYDALKAASPSVRVIGGAVSPRGIDRPNTGRDTHSPSTFIPDLGAAYRASGRTTPIMDAFAFHPYNDTSSQPPTFQHPNSSTVTLADYSKLVALLGKAFDGTAQPGSAIPIVYDEYGVESTVPPEHAGAYTGTEPATTKPVDEATQADYYRQALQLAFCQPTVQTLLLFHVVDEPALSAWQSGVYYADGTPKASRDPVTAAVRDARGGVIAKCPGLALTPVPAVAWPKGPQLAEFPLALLLTCDVDCIYYARLERYPAHSTTLVSRGIARAGEPTTVVFPARRVAKGQYRLTLKATAPVNTGTPTTVASPPFAYPPAGGVTTGATVTTGRPATTSAPRPATTAPRPGTTTAPGPAGTTTAPGPATTAAR